MNMQIQNQNNSKEFLNNKRGFDQVVVLDDYALHQYNIDQCAEPKSQSIDFDYCQASTNSNENSEDYAKQYEQEHNNHMKILLKLRHLNIKGDDCQDLDPDLMEKVKLDETCKKYKKDCKTESEVKVVEGQCYYLRKLYEKMDMTFLKKEVDSENQTGTCPLQQQKEQHISLLQKDQIKSIYEKLYELQKTITISRINPTGRNDEYFFPAVCPTRVKVAKQLINQKSGNLNSKISQNSEITIAQFQTMTDMMNDVLINNYIEMMVKDTLKPTKIFNSYLFQYLSDPKVDWKKITRIANKKQVKNDYVQSFQYFDIKILYKKIDIQKDKFFVPMNLSNAHWAFCEVNCIDQTITFFDSVITSFKTLNQHNLPQFLQQKLGPVALMVTQLQENQKAKKFDFLLKIGPTAIQEKGNSCGVFMLKAMHYKMLDYKITFTQEDIPSFIDSMSVELLDGKLI